MKRTRGCAWLPPAHVHFFTATSSTELGHHHLLRLYTFSVNGDAYDGHVHDYKGITGIKYGHYHRYFGTTGPAIPLADGSHFHLVDGVVELNLYNSPRQGAVILSAQKEGVIAEPHRHAYAGATGTGIGYDR